MIIKELFLQNFRSYPKNNFSFSPQTTVVLGDNASGKTNLLEAITLLSIGKSFRADKDSESVAFRKEVGRVRGGIQLDNEERKLEVMVTRGEVMGVKTPIKKYSINGVPKRMLDFIGTLKVVLFWPQDMELVTDSPSLRRRYLDFVLTQVDREYRRTIISYEKGLRQRNKLLELLRDGKAHRHQLIFWDQLLIKNGEYITTKREEYISYINDYQIITNDQVLNYQLVYDRSIISKLRLTQYEEEEIAAGATLVGPHRDDFKFKIKEELRDLSLFGSRGEQRLAVLWLKLRELAFIEEKTGDKPVLLLDDILSELDHGHRAIIFSLFGQQQTIITATDRHLLPSTLRNKDVIELR